MKPQLRPRRLFSGYEATGLFSVLPDSTIHARSWGQIHFKSVLLHGTGQLILPPLDCHCVSVSVGEAATIFQDHGGMQYQGKMEEGDGFILPAGRASRFEWFSACSLLSICIAPRLLMQAAEETGASRPDLFKLSSCFQMRDTTISHISFAIAQEATLASHPGQEVLVSSLARALACRLIGNFCTHTAQAIPSFGGLDAKTLGRLFAYIEENIGERITLNSLASVAGVSRFHFCRLFRQSTGESVMGYLLRSRVEHAKDILRSGTLSVGQVAHQLGFSDQSHFARVFRRITGIAPKEFMRLK